MLFQQRGGQSGGFLGAEQINGPAVLLPTSAPLVARPCLHSCCLTSKAEGRLPIIGEDLLEGLLRQLPNFIELSRAGQILDAMHSEIKGDLNNLFVAEGGVFYRD